MSLRACKENGKPGWKMGEGGTCYTYDPDSAGGSAVAKAKALKEAAEIGTHGNANGKDGQVQI